jgi:hypothetical protein
VRNVSRSFATLGIRERMRGGKSFEDRRGPLIPV